MLQNPSPHPSHLSEGTATDQLSLLTETFPLKSLVSSDHICSSFSSLEFEREVYHILPTHKAKPAAMPSCQKKKKKGL